MTQNTLEELKNFEKQQQKKLEQIESDSLKNVEQAKKDIDKRLKKEKEDLQKIKEEKLQATKEKAKEEAKTLVDGYKDKIVQLEKNSSKNFKKAVDKVFSIIFKKNV